MPAIVYNGNVYGEAPTDIFSTLGYLAIGSSDRVTKMVQIPSGYVNTNIVPIYTATKDCIINISGYVNFPVVNNINVTAAANILVDNIPLFASGTALNKTFNLPLSGLFYLKSGQVLKVQIVQESGSTMDCGIYYAQKIIEL